MVVVLPPNVVVVAVPNVLVVAVPNVVVVITFVVVVIEHVVVVVTEQVVVVGVGVVVVGTSVVVGVTLVGFVVDVAGIVVVLSQTRAPSGDPGITHGSQQLAGLPSHADPPRGALHLPRFVLTEHFIRPRRSVRQHVTPLFVLPHPEFAAQRMTSLLHSLARSPDLTRFFAIFAAHFTNRRWLRAVSQLHSDSAANRAATRAS